MSEKENVFIRLNKLNVSEHVEKKGRFSYLSWTWAVSELRKAYPSATWEVIKNNGLPFTKTECGYFVEVSVTVEGLTLSQIHPVLDSSNKTIPVPNAFQINTSIQRCLVKAIALHGLGLYIYAGEDLPEDEAEDKFKVKPPQDIKPTSGALDNISKDVLDVLKDVSKNIIHAHKIGDLESMVEGYDLLKDNDHKMALWELLKPYSEVRSAIKNMKASKK